MGASGSGEPGGALQGDQGSGVDKAIIVVAHVARNREGQQSGERHDTGTEVRTGAGPGSVVRQEERRCDEQVMQRRPATQTKVPEVRRRRYRPPQGGTPPRRASARRGPQVQATTAEEVVDKAGGGRARRGAVGGDAEAAFLRKRYG